MRKKLIGIAAITAMGSLCIAGNLFSAPPPEVLPKMPDQAFDAFFITNADLADNAVSTSKIQDAAVTTSKIQDGAVTDAKISGPISTGKIDGLDNALNDLTQAVDAGWYKYTPNSTEPFPCTSDTTVNGVDVDGYVALTSKYNLCACNAPESRWVFTHASATDCDWGVATITCESGYVWMDRNLGADRAATSVSDTASYGDLYQWGRRPDGHQIRRYVDGLLELSNTTTEISTTTTPEHGEFILVPLNWFPQYYSNDWRKPNDGNLWKGTDPVIDNNPCPDGFRLPSIEELSTILDSINASPFDFDSQCPKLPAAGYREWATQTGGRVIMEGIHGQYWSNTDRIRPYKQQEFIDARSLGLSYHTDNNKMYAYENSSYHSHGFSVRCIQD